MKSLNDIQTFLVVKFLFSIAFSVQTFIVTLLIYMIFSKIGKLHHLCFMGICITVHAELEK